MGPLGVALPSCLPSKEAIGSWEEVQTGSVFASELLAPADVCIAALKGVQTSDSLCSLWKITFLLPASVSPFVKWYSYL